MEINVKSLKFDASEKLAQFVEKKVSRIEKFCEGLSDSAEVTLENLKEGKKAKIQVHIPGDEVIIERTSDTFENAISAAADAMKEKLTRIKEKMQQK
ncbi:MAG: ribosome-associated translation inhibitor RaiA [Bacteroidales bacterium]|nr:ribosome-associated translation inhibitor RaiA [Bacteroidales bacterium]